jgi:uridine kinase
VIFVDGRRTDMDRQIEISLYGQKYKVREGTTLEELLKEFGTGSVLPIVAAKVDNKIRELTFPLKDDSTVEWLDIGDKDGERIYVRSLVFLFIRACKELFPECSVSVEHSLCKGLYCEVHGSYALTPRQVHRIEEKMREIVAADEPFTRFNATIEEADTIFNEMGFADKAEVFKYRPESTVSLYRCGWMVDYLYGYMVPSTGYIKSFDLKFYLPGVILRYPTGYANGRIPDFEDSPKLFKVFRQTEKWMRRLNIQNVADLNRQINSGSGDDLIRICEAQHEKQIAAIADEISMQRDRIRLILIAGPSSSGKTTFAQRLRVQLMVNGLYPIPISMDDYFLNRSEVPYDENGEQDLESIDIIDLELFNEHMTRIIQGQAVEIPHFNFNTGMREYRGNIIKINQDQPIIVEGIHGLNEKLTAMIPKENKYKIYISALTQLNVDAHNRIPTTDTRLIRRMIRDYKFRGTPIDDTMRMWSSVRRGEEEYIFPFQEQADTMFNSALIYELAVLKPFILPMLSGFAEDHPFHSEFLRLRKFMKYFVDLDPTPIPLVSPNPSKDPFWGPPSSSLHCFSFMSSPLSSRSGMVSTLEKHRLPIIMISSSFALHFSALISTSSFPLVSIFST